MAELLVVDQNAIRREDLLAPFLQSDPANRVILTDFCCMESYKGVADLTLPNSLRTLAPFGDQVVVLLGTRDVVSKTAVARCDSLALIDTEQTAGFGQFCRDVCSALSGNAILRATLLEHAEVANGYLAQVRAEAAGIAPAILEIATELPPPTVKRLRQGAQPTIDDIEEFTRGILILTRTFFDTHPDRLPLPSASLLPHTFVFRYSVSAYLLAVDWVRRGGIAGATPDRLANDIVDMNYVAFATYFDGIISNDRKLQSIYAEALWFIREVFARESVPDAI